MTSSEKENTSFSGSLWSCACTAPSGSFSGRTSLYMAYYIAEGSLEVKLPTIWTDEKAEVRRARREQSQEKSQKRKDQKKEDAGVWKGRKVAKHCFFSMFYGSGGSKSRLAKAAGAETSGGMRNEKLHAVVARSRFWSEKVQNTWVSEHFWKLRCRKSARRCGAKHRFGPLLEVQMSKKCTPLWREAHFEVKMYKTLRVRATFGSSDVVLRGRRKGLCTLSKVSKTWGPCSISKKDGRRISRGRCSTKEYKRHVHQRCSEVRALISWEGLHFGASDLQVCWDDFAWQVQHFVWPGINVSWQAQYFTSTLHFWRKSRRIALFLTLLSSNIEEVSQNCCGFGRC